MPLFYFSRESENVIDKPHVSIKIWSWCPAWCDCEFSYKKIKKNILYSKDWVLDNLKYSIENFSDDFEIFLVGMNLLKYPYLFEILDYIKNHNRIFKLQIPHRLDDEDKEILNKIVKKYGSFQSSIPKTIDKADDFKNLLKQLIILDKIEWIWKVYFDIFLDIHQYKNIIDSIIKKLSTRESNNELNCIVGDKFDLKFHDLSWKINKEEKEISKLKRKSCLMKNYFHIEWNKIYLQDHIEILPSKDLTFHDNLCYLGYFSISNIDFDQERLLEDFKKYENYLKQISQWNLKTQCYKCIKNWYKYSKSDNQYTF